MNKPLITKIVDFLKENEGKSFSTDELTTTLKKFYMDEYANKPYEQLKAEIASCLSRAEKTERFPEIKLLEGVSPFRRYYDANDSGPTQHQTKETHPQKIKRNNQQRERLLYEPLEIYLKEIKGIAAETIEAGRSSNTGGQGKNKWRHPDVVGVEGLISNKKWIDLVQNLSNEFNNPKARIWSFEVKEKINIGNVRECYHQAVANSSWANFGYLCVGSIEGGENIDEELSMLTNTYGIGIIVINLKKPTESIIKIEAREREFDFDVCNSLAKENKQFRKFLKYAITIYKSGMVF